jgi:hypothetical protein
MFARMWLIAAVSTCLGSHGEALPIPGVPGSKRANPPDLGLPAYTAFPEIRLPNGPDGKPTVVTDWDRRLARLPGASQPVPADAPPHAKLWAAQVNEWRVYILRVQTRIVIGQYWTEEYFQYLNEIAGMFEQAAELEPTAAGKIAAYEARLLVYKESERFMVARVESGNSPPQELNRIRFDRLQAEADLILLKERLDEAAKK